MKHSDKIGYVINELKDIRKCVKGLEKLQVELKVVKAKLILLEIRSNPKEIKKEVGA